MNITPEMISDRLHEIIEINDSNYQLFQSCEDTSEILNYRKKPDADTSTLRFRTAAAIIAYGRYLQLENMDSCGISAFKAGDINLNFDSGDGKYSAEQIINSALAEISDMLEDRDFVFEAV